MSKQAGDETIGVVGAGAMGGGIAQVAALHGHRVILADAQAASIANARAVHSNALEREVVKGRLSRDDADAALSRMR